MNDLIKDFLYKSVNASQISCFELLESARTVAICINENNFASFCEKEIKGYGMTEPVPTYRKIKACWETWKMGHPSGIRVFPVGEYSEIPKKPLYCWKKELKDWFCRVSIAEIDRIISKGCDYDSWFENSNLSDCQCKIVINLFYYESIAQEVRNTVNDWKNQMIEEGKIKMDQEPTPMKVEFNNYGGQTINNTGSISGPISQSSEANSFDFEKARELVSYIKEQLKHPEISEENFNLLNTQIKLIDEKITKLDSKGLTNLFSALGTWAQNIACSVVGSEIYKRISEFSLAIQ